GGFFMGRLDGKVTIITGGSQGMGAAHVRKFIEEGSKVVIADILEDKGNTLAEELGDNAAFMKLDVTKADEWENAVEKTESTFGPVNVLVNNAGIDIMKPFIDFTENDLRKVLDVNLISQFHGMQKILPSMKKVGSGSIINISSLEGLRGTAGNSIY